MTIKKNERSKIIAIFALALLLLHVNPQDVFELVLADQETEISGYKVWDSSQTINGIINVNPGATLVIKKGITLTMDSYSKINVLGNLYINGTAKEKINIKKIENMEEADGFSFIANSGGNISIRNVDVSGGGSDGRLLDNSSKITRKAYAGTENAGFVLLNGGRMDIQSTNFHDNYYTIGVASDADPHNLRVNRSSFVDNRKDITSDSKQSFKIDFKYNWWGDSNGPKKVCISQYSCYMPKLTGNIDFQSWRSQESFRDPVIIIPGIVGSAQRENAWQIDPVFHTYDNLYQEMANNGYVPEQNLFTFPYEWRDSNMDNAKLLRDKINQIKQQLNWPKVDVVAHSMGGLLAREYIESDYYQNDVDQLITLGTPHNGAPEAYLKWEGDAWFWTPSDIYIKHLLNQEMEESDQEYEDIFDYVHERPIESLRELLPVYSYLRNALDADQIRIYPDGHPQNEFLESLNSETKKAKLLNVEFDKIVGKTGGDSSTIAGYNIIDFDMGKKWEHGYPQGFEIIIGDRGIFRSSGDRTVPVFSAKSDNIPSDNVIEINSVHRDIATKAQSDVLELLTSIRPIEESLTPMIKNILIISVYSPVDIQVVETNTSRIVGKDFQTGNLVNEIPGAFYSGFDTENEFITIPNPDDGEYQILTQGTGNGSFKIKMAKISENEDGSATESTAEVEGTAQENVLGKPLKVQVQGNEVIPEETKDTTPPTITIANPQNKEYKNNEVVNIEYEIADNKSQENGITKTVVLDEMIYDKDSVDLSLLKLGNHFLQIKAIDEAGNEGSAEIEFVTKADIDSTILNIKHYFYLGLIKKKNEKQNLLVALKVIKQRSEFLEMINQNPHISARTKGIIAQIVNEQINMHLDFMIKHVEKMTRAYDPLAKELLLDALKSLKI